MGSNSKGRSNSSKTSDNVVVLEAAAVIQTFNVRQ